MASETSGGGGNNEPASAPRPTIKKARRNEFTGPASAKSREVGVRYKNTEGLSPGAVRSIVGNVEGVPVPSYTVPTTPEPDDTRGNYEREALGATKTVSPRSSDVVAANMAGRSDITKEQLGDLVTRARVGQLPDVQIPGAGGMGLNVLNTIGKANASNLLRKIASDAPTIENLGDEPKYDVGIVENPDTGAIAGVTDTGLFGGRVYSGSPDYNPMTTGGLMSGGSNTTPAPPSAAPKKATPAPEEPTGGTVSTAVRATSKNRKRNLMGRDATTELAAKGLLSNVRADRILMRG